MLGTHVSSGSFWLWAFSDFLVLDDVTVLRSTGPVFCERSLTGWDLYHLFLTIRLQLRVLGRNATKVKCHSHHNTSTTHAITWLTPFDANLALGQGLSPLSILCSGRKSQHNPHLRSGEYLIRYLKIFLLCGRFAYSNLCMYLVNHLFISVWTHEYLFQSSGYIQCYLIFYSDCPSSGHWELLQVALLSFWHTPSLQFSEHFLFLWCKMLHLVQVHHVHLQPPS